MRRSHYKQERQVSEAGETGIVVQVVRTQTGAVATGTTTIPLDDTIPQNTEGDEYMTLAITPRHAANILDIDIVFNGAISGNGHLIVGLFKDSDADALAAVPQRAGPNDIHNVKFEHSMVAGGTSEITFKVRAGPDLAATTTFNGSSANRFLGGAMASSIKITERTP